MKNWRKRKYTNNWYSCILLLILHNTKGLWEGSLGKGTWHWLWCLELHLPDACGRRQASKKLFSFLHMCAFMCTLHMQINTIKNFKLSNFEVVSKLLSIQFPSLVPHFLAFFLVNLQPFGGLWIKIWHSSAICIFALRNTPATGFRSLKSVSLRHGFLFK